MSGARADLRPAAEACSPRTPSITALRRVPALLGIGLVWAWRLTLGALFPTSCKYHPSCSQYAIDALGKHGLLKGAAKAGWRLLRCNPWSPGGVDHA